MGNFLPSDVQLSAEQLEIVNADSTAILVVASAGSGKTEVVARRVQRLLQNADTASGRVLALTYTIKAADELKSRLRDRTGENVKFVDAETVHGFAHSLLRQHGTKIGLPLEPELLTRDEDRAELMNLWRTSQGLPLLEDTLDVLRSVDLDRAKLQTNSEVQDWEAALESVQALDYPALLVAARKLLEVRSARRQLNRVYSHVIVDEAQNLTPAQYDLISAILGGPGTGAGATAMFVGDDKQSIISFAGADPRLLHRFATEYEALTIRLTVNFRSAKRVSELATRVADALGNVNTVETAHAADGLVQLAEGSDEEGEGRIVADWVADLLSNGMPSQALSVSEPTAMSPEDIAVIGRSASSMKSATAELAAKGIEFTSLGTKGDWLEGAPANVALEIVAMKGAESHRSTHWHLSRLLGVLPERVSSVGKLRLVLESHESPMMRMLAPLLDADTVSDFFEVLRGLTWVEGPSDTELASWESDLALLLATWGEFDLTTERSALNWASFRIFCSRKQRGEEGRGVQVLTIHKSQGREFRAVAIVGLNDGQFPDFRNTTPDQLQSELRAFYVAVTRSRRILLLTRARSRSTRYGARVGKPSPFLGYARL